MSIWDLLIEMAKAPGTYKKYAEKTVKEDKLLMGSR